MLFDTQQRGQIVDLCWLIYELISQNFVPPDEFHIRYPNFVDLAFITGYFKLVVEIGGTGYTLHVNEEYGFVEYKLVLKAYVYILFD